MPRGREPRATRRDDRSQARQHPSCPWGPHSTHNSTPAPAALGNREGHGPGHQARGPVQRAPNRRKNRQKTVKTPVDTAPLLQG
jgi:hypothetical protein